MRINEFFSIKRFSLLLKRDVFIQYKTYLTGLGAIFCILFIVNIASIASCNAWNFNLVFYPLTLFIGGFVFTSLCFVELNQAQSRIFYISLPASSLEKLLSKLLITGIGYVSVSSILYFVFSLIAFLFNSLVFGFAHRIFYPFHPVILYCIRIYLITHSVFFLGAVYFRKNAFLKTIVSLFVIASVYAVFILGISYLMYIISSFNRHIYFSFDLFYNLSQNGINYPSVVRVIAGILLYTIQILFWFILAPLLWIISYFRLKEIEV